MPVLNDLSAQPIVGSHYSFSATRVQDLGASEYTLVVLVADCSSSVAPFAAEIEAAIQQVVKACGRSPRADNLLLRFVTFNSTVSERHGYLPLSQCNPARYDDSIHPSGLTSLFDATYDAVQSVAQYGRTLRDNDFATNAIVFVLTDGEDVSSTLRPSTVAKAVATARQDEVVESLRTVLIGINPHKNAHLTSTLEVFRAEAKLDQYLDIGSASAASLAKVADFVSRSISAQSQALGTGGPSTNLTF